MSTYNLTVGGNYITYGGKALTYSSENPKRYTVEFRITEAAEQFLPILGLDFDTNWTSDTLEWDFYTLSSGCYYQTTSGGTKIYLTSDDLEAIRSSSWEGSGGSYDGWGKSLHLDIRTNYPITSISCKIAPVVAHPQVDAYVYVKSGWGNVTVAKPTNASDLQYFQWRGSESGGYSRGIAFTPNKSYQFPVTTQPYYSDFDLMQNGLQVPAGSMG